jgi:hypothetical protein
MPRPPRVFTEGIYHLASHGSDTRHLFLDAADRAALGDRDDWRHRYREFIEATEPTKNAKGPVSGAFPVAGQDLNLRPPGYETSVARSGDARTGLLRPCRVRSDHVTSRQAGKSLGKSSAPTHGVA